MAYVYIIKSLVQDKFYIGFTNEIPELRLQRHNEDYYQNKYTSKFKPWVLFWNLPCQTEGQARAIESHIKKMKSKTYLNNLVKFPEMAVRLISKYADC